MIILILFLIMYISGFIAFLLIRKHLILLLLRLEFIILGLFLFLILILIKFVNEYYFMIVFIIFIVCEGVLGLSIMVSLVRIYGNDYFQRFNLIIC